MDENIELAVKRLKDLEKRSYNNNTFEFGDFLSPAEFDAFRKVSPAGEAFGGYAQAERRMLRFGDPEELGYDVPFPIDCIKVSSASGKFSSPLTHRDYLGALMSLGVERRVFGDIVVRNGIAYIFCENRMSPFILENLVSVGRNQVHVEISDFPEEEYEAGRQQMAIQVSSPRADAVIAHVCKLSRGNVTPYFTGKLVQLNGRILERPDKLLTEGDIFSVRGFGKYAVGESTGVSKKGKTNILIYKYV